MARTTTSLKHMQAALIETYQIGHISQDIPSESADSTQCATPSAHTVATVRTSYIAYLNTADGNRVPLWYSTTLPRVIHCWPRSTHQLEKSHPPTQLKIDSLVPDFQPSSRSSAVRPAPFGYDEPSLAPPLVGRPHPRDHPDWVSVCRRCLVGAVSAEGDSTTGGHKRASVRGKSSGIRSGRPKRRPSRDYHALPPALTRATKQAKQV
jgi:hypothetical protein